MHTHIITFTLAQNLQPVVRTIRSKANYITDDQLDDLVAEIEHTTGALDRDTRNGFPAFVWARDGKEVGGN